MWDADNHLYETREAFTAYLPEDRRRDLYWVSDERGHQHIMMGGHVWDYVPNPTFDPISKAGALTDLFSGAKSKAEIYTDGFRIVEPLADHPEYQHREARLATLERQGIEGCLLFPTLASGIEERVRDDIPLLHDILWAFNRWLDEAWGFDIEDRVFPAPFFALADVDRAVAMLEWALERGCRVIDLRSAPVLTAEGFRSPGREEFDPFWARCQEAGVLVGVHGGPVSYTKYTGDWSGDYEYHAFERSAFEHIALHGRAVSDFFTAMVCHGALTRHSRLKVVSVENGGDWIPPLVDTMKIYYHRYPASFPEDPIEAFTRGVWVSPFWEDDIAEITGCLPVTRILAGSDFPHAEGLSEPTDFVKGLSAFDEADTRRIMRENLRELLTS
jgi:predicted TIM-barrel fold metal-dependent hydrolase